MSKIDVAEILEYLELIGGVEEFVPVFKKVVNVGVSYLKELDEPLRDFQKWIREGRVGAVRFYESKGFTKEESILMSMHDSTSLSEAMKSFSNKKPKE